MNYEQCPDYVPGESFARHALRHGALQSWQRELLEANLAKEEAEAKEPTPLGDKVCANCQQAFESKRSDARTCGPACRTALSRKKVATT